jgi:peptide-methionine (S)-S-oxide reductase
MAFFGIKRSPMTSPSNVFIPNDSQRIYLGGGCFWCLEALFLKQKGVVRVTSGYAGGSSINPTYEEVCTGRSGHAEVIEVIFDPKKITYRQLLDFFWQAHDPTTLNAQGADYGTQYRSVIFTTSAEEAKKAEASRQAAQAAFVNPIVTKIEPLEQFFPAEKYHQNYYALHSNVPYCRMVITPKIKKLFKATD